MKNFQPAISNLRSPPGLPLQRQAPRSTLNQKSKPKPLPLSRPAFSLVEVLVTVSIIVILVGLTIVVGVKMKDSARISHTRLTLHQAKAIADEYYVATNNDTVISLNGNSSIGTQWDWTTVRTQDVLGLSGTAAIKGTDTIGSDADMKKYSGERFVWAAWQFEGAQKMLIALGTNVLVDKATASDPTDPVNGFYEIRDDWGSKIVYFASSAGGFLPDHPTPFFASAGPDGGFGNVNAATISSAELAPFKNPGETDADARIRLANEVKDNLYSYDSE